MCAYNFSITTEGHETMEMKQHKCFISEHGSYPIDHLIITYRYVIALVQGN